MDDRRKKQIAGAVVLALVAYGLYAFINRPKTSEEAAIRGVIQAMATAIEEADYKDFTVHLAEDYRDNRGHKNKASMSADIANLCRRFALKNRLTVSIKEMQVALAESRKQAKVTMTFASWERSANTPRAVDVIPGNARTLHFELDVVLSDGHWLVREATQIQK